MEVVPQKTTRNNLQIDEYGRPRMGGTRIHEFRRFRGDGMGEWLISHMLIIAQMFYLIKGFR